MAARAVAASTITEIPVKKYNVVVCAVLTAVALAACGGGTKAKTGTTIHPSGTNPTSTVDTNAYKASKLTQAQAGQAFINAVTPVNDTLDSVGTQLEKLASGTGGAEIGKLAQPGADALSKLNLELQNLAKGYPVAASDLSNLEQSYQPMIVDLDNLKNVNRSNYKKWELQYAKDVAKVEAADKIVRQELGIPKSQS
jgi:hypothetical protein